MKTRKARPRENSVGPSLMKIWFEFETRLTEVVYEVGWAAGDNSERLFLEVPTASPALETILRKSDKGSVAKGTDIQSRERHS